MTYSTIDTHVSSGRKKDRRGFTKITAVQKVRASAEKIRLEIDTRGDVLGEHANVFMSYLRVCARSHVAITNFDWRNVTDQQKTNMWTDIRSTYDFDKKLLPRKKVMANMSKMWRDWKSELYNEYVIGDHAGEDPCLVYDFINHDQWESFVEFCLFEEAEKLTEKNIEKVKSSKYQHVLSRGGYRDMLWKIRAERLCEFRARAVAQGLDPSITEDQVPHSSRSELIWVSTKKRKLTGEYFTDESLSVGKRVEELTQQVKDGKFVEEDKKDILTVALEKDESIECVGGVGKGKDSKSVFGSSCGGRSSGSLSQDQIKEYVKDAIAQARNQIVGTIGNVMKSIAVPDSNGFVKFNMHQFLDKLGYKEADLMTTLPQQAKSIESSCSDESVKSS